MAGSARTFSFFPFVSSSLAQGPRQSGDIQQTFWIRLAYAVPALKNLPALGTQQPAFKLAVIICKRTKGRLEKGEWEVKRGKRLTFLPGREELWSRGASKLHFIYSG